MDQSNNIASPEVFDQLGLKDLDDTQKQHITKILTELIQSRLSNRLAEFMSEDDMTQLDNLVQQNDVDGVETFVRSKIPGYDELVREVSNQTIEQLAAQKAEVMSALKSGT